MPTFKLFAIKYLKFKKITLSMLNELIAKIKQDQAGLDKNSESQMIVEQFNRTLDFLREKSKLESSPFDGINLM